MKKDYENMSDEEFNRLNEEKSCKKRKNKGIRNCLIFFAVMLIAMFYFTGKSDDKNTPADTTSSTTASTNSTNSITANKTTTNTTTNKTTTTPKTETKKEPETIVFEAEFADGNYICGIHFPAGKYDVEAVSGSGYVRSSNFLDGGISAAMGTKEDDVSEFKNAKFEKNDILSVAFGLTVRIHSNTADATPLKCLNQSDLKTVTLSSGNYIVGEDFSTGVYDVIAVKGSGNVISDNIYEGGINALMKSADEKPSNEYVSEFKNVVFSDGMELSINGVTINLVPSK